MQVLVTGVEAVEVLRQLLPLKIIACCYDNKNTNTAWPTIPVKNLKYRKVAISRPVYYSVFDHFGGATKVHSFCKQCLHNDLVFIN